MPGTDAQPLRATMRAFLIAAMVLCGLVLFHLQGNTTSARVHGTSAIWWMILTWSEKGGAMSHGWAVPLVSAYFIWRRREPLFSAERRSYAPGLVLVVLLLMLHLLGLRAQQSRFALFSMIGLLWAVPLYLAGPKVARVLFFPAAYLLFMVPWAFFDSITFPLRQIGAVVAAGIVNGLGVEVQRVGTAIYSASGAGFNIDVADACSGLRSLVAMLAITVAYANVSQPNLWRKTALSLAAVPLAVAGNIARIVSIALVGNSFGGDVAMNMYHDYSTYIMFTTAILLMFSIEPLLARIQRRLKPEATA